MYLQGLTRACELPDDLKSYQAWSELFCTRKCCESYQIHTSCSVVPALSTEIRKEARLCTLSDQIDKIIQLLFLFFNAFSWEMEDEWNATKVQRLCLDRMWSNGLLAGSGLFPSTSIMFIRLRTTSRSGAESRENNHCIRSLACCISIVPHLIAYFDLRQLL